MSKYANINETTVKVAKPNKVKAFFQTLEKGFEYVIAKAPEWAFKAGLALGRFIRDCINITVKLSIIAIAAILICTFIESHPAEWTSFTSTIKDVFDAVKNAVIDAHNNVVNTLFWFR